MNIEAPPIEQLRKGFILPPRMDQRTTRQYHKRLDLFEVMRNIFVEADKIDDYAERIKAKRRGLDDDQFEAAKKLDKHYRGSLGHDVRSTDEFTSELRDLDGVPPQTYHSDKIVEARNAIGDKQAWMVLEFSLLGCERLVDMGRFIYKVRCEKKAVTLARKAMQDSLITLSILWGLSTHPPTR